MSDGEVRREASGEPSSHPFVVGAKSISTPRRRVPHGPPRLLDVLQEARLDARLSGAGDRFVHGQLVAAMRDLFGPEPAADEPLAPRANLLEPRGSVAMVRARHGYMLYNPNDEYVGQALERYGEYNEAECELFRRICRRGDTVVEVGAHVGAHTVALARLVGSRGTVHAIEAQRRLFHLLCANAALSEHPRLFCHHFAATSRDCELVVLPVDYSKPFNFGGIGLRREGPGERVRGLPLDRMLTVDRLRLLKVDVEGMEREVIVGARRLIEAHRPVIYLENDRVDRSPALIRLLRRLDYDLFWHLPPLFNPKNFYAASRNVYGNTVSCNMLCMPRGDTSVKHDLAPVKSAREHPKQPS